MAMDLLPSLLTQVAGGAGAAYADRAFPQAAVHVGDIVITPGAMAAVGLTIALAIGLPIPAKSFVANLAGGALVYEGTKLAEQQVIPMVENLLGSGDKSAGALPPYYGSVYGPGMTDYELQQALYAYRGA